MLNRSALPAAAVTVVFLVASCGDSADEGIEQLIEQQTGGNVEIDSGNGGFSVQTEDGSMTMDEDGNFVVTDEDGETVTGQANEDGVFEMESDDGSFSMDSGGDVPEEWPAAIPVPEGLAGLSSMVANSDGDLQITLTGTAGSGFVDEYGSSLESSGFTETSSYESDGNVIKQYESDAWAVSVNSFAEGDSQQVTVALYPKSS